MQFYRFDGYYEGKYAEDLDGRSRDSEVAKRINARSTTFFCNSECDSYFFVNRLSENSLTVGAIIKSVSDLKYLEEYLSALGITLSEEMTKAEITYHDLSDMLITACRSDYIDDDDKVLNENGIGLQRIDDNFNENLISECSKKHVMASAAKLMESETLLPELERIYEGKTVTNFCGHPTHYLMQTDDEENRKYVWRSLFEALYAKKRLANKRYSFTDISNRCCPNAKQLNMLYSVNVGGALVIRYTSNNDDDDEEEYASDARASIEIICKSIKRYRNSVLTVLCLPREATKLKSIFFEYLGNITFVEVKEQPADSDKAGAFLRERAKRDGLTADATLLSLLESDKGYYSYELNEIYDNWLDKELKNTIYPSYRDMAPVKQAIKEEKPKGAAYDELQALIGLNEAKNLVKQLLDYYKAQKMFSDMGISRNRMAMHCVFTGNPGTCKTTVARLFARILKENGMVTKGQFIECGRADLVDRYVGGTAPRIKQKFALAKGGVLFMDEIYSLIDDRRGSFGDEAINTIVQEMENMRDEVVVIMAGYPKEMEAFLDRNPGLRSRIAFHIPFSDYTAKELLQILELQAKQTGMHFTEDAAKLLETHFAAARCNANFGNGRYVRSIMEKAEMAHAVRLVAMNPELVTENDVKTLTEDDFDFLREALPTVVMPKIGFCA